MAATGSYGQRLNAGWFPTLALSNPKCQKTFSTKPLTNKSMQAIYTKYLPATNLKPSRIKATCDAGSLTIPYPHEFDEEGAHIEAARLLCVKLDDENQAKYGANSERTWSKPKACGGLPMEQGGYVHVFLPDYVSKIQALRDEGEKLRTDARAEEKACGQTERFWKLMDASEQLRKEAKQTITHGYFYQSF